ncbi:alpha/beta fold hydrolase [Sphingobium sp. Z007]|uniref:alpha/beta fold hydrolase n=1 Tax=Sphingobium sp. Z007 TaxID=627495 RepID=UPI0020CE8376|nr:alpha/beta hydrolase [Sphingobium sp. Z007]
MIRFDGFGGVALAADVAGPANGASVLFLHGGGQTRHSWGRAVDEAAARGFRAITLDLRGHGDSDWAPDGDYRIDAHVADIRAVVATLPDVPALVGASLGGLASLLATGESPAPIARGLVLVDVVPQIEMEGAQEIRAFMTGNADGFATVEAAADAVAAYLPHRTRPSSSAGLMKNLRRRDDGRLHWHWDPAMLGDLKGLDPAAREARFTHAATKVRVPTLLIRGGMSRIVSMDGVAAFRRAMPHSEFINIEQADHMVAGDANDAFNAPLLDFLDRSR